MGIQEYLFENGRIDNIFTDVYYDAFTTAMHEVIRTFTLPTNEMGYFVTRIEEEHLWEAKQLGAHSPQVSTVTETVYLSHLDKSWPLKKGTFNSNAMINSEGFGDMSSTQNNRI